MSELLTVKRYFYFDKETGTGSAWGTEPTTPVLVHVPLGESTVKQTRAQKNNRRRHGLATWGHSQATSKQPAGQITCPLLGAWDSGPNMSLAQFLLQWALGDGSTTTLETLDAKDSMTVYDIQRDGGGTERASKRYHGLRVSKMTLKGSEDGFVELSLDIIGKSQSALGGAAAALPNDREKLLEFLFADCTFTLGGSNFPICAFELTADFGLKPKFETAATAAGSTGGNPTRLPGTKCDLSLTIQPVKEVATYDDYQKLLTTTELSAVLTAQGLHNGTGASGDYSKVGLTMARCALKNADEVFGADDIAMQPLVFDVLKPDTSALAIVQAWSLV